jgi:hypothetical protein
MEIYNSLKSTFKISLLTIIVICNFCYINSANSGIISEPTVDIISPTGWIALQGTILANNHVRFDTKCEYRITTSDQNVFYPIQVGQRGLVFKPSSKNRLTEILYENKHTLIYCHDGNSACKQRNEDETILKLEERCPNYMEIYLNHKFSTMFHAMQSIMSSSSSSSIVDSGEQEEDH